MNVTNIIYAILILGIMGGVFGIILAIASKIFYVPQDERLEPLCDCLPGANCGGCGYTGCTAYAQAIIDGKADLTKCAAGGPEAAAAYFKANDLTKLPSPKKLEAEYAQLASEKATFYEQYKEAKEELLKLKTAKQNVASFFREEDQTQQER